MFLVYQLHLLVEAASIGLENATGHISESFGYLASVARSRSFIYLRDDITYIDMFEYLFYVNDRTWESKLWENFQFPLIDLIRPVRTQIPYSPLETAWRATSLRVLHTYAPILVGRELVHTYAPLSIKFGWSRVGSYLCTSFHCMNLCMYYPKLLGRTP